MKTPTLEETCPECPVIKACGRQAQSDQGAGYCCIIRSTMPFREYAKLYGNMLTHSPIPDRIHTHFVAFERASFFAFDMGGNSLQAHKDGEKAEEYENPPQPRGNK